MKKILIKAICSMAIIATMVSVVGCNSKTTETATKSTETKATSNEPEEIEIITAKDKVHKIAVPKEWTASTDKDEKIIIQQEDKDKSQNLSVTSEAKARLPKGSNIQTYAFNIMDSMKKAFKNVNCGPTKQLKVGDKDAVQFCITAPVGQTNLTYFITVLDDGTNMVRIGLWVPTDKFDESRDLFNQITNSFR